MQHERVYKTTEAERERARLYRLNNPEKAKAAVKRWTAANPDKIAERTKQRAATDREGLRRRQRAYVERNKAEVAERIKKYTGENREKVADAKRRYKQKHLATPHGRLNSRISAQIRAALGRGGKGGQSAAELLGWNVQELMEHLEKQFLRGMSWENMSDWHIDHIVPLTEFAKHEPFDVKAAWALCNLRPLWATENQSKGGRRVHLL